MPSAENYYRYKKKIPYLAACVLVSRKFYMCTSILSIQEEKVGLTTYNGELVLLG
jgi:hypothetical protein